MNSETADDVNLPAVARLYSALMTFVFKQVITTAEPRMQVIPRQLQAALVLS